MQKFVGLVQKYLSDVKEIMPWDLEERMQENPDLMVLDVREPAEFDIMHIEDSLNVPRGILESACEWDFEETEPKLVCARKKEIVIVCRSGYRSVLAAFSLQVLGFENVVSLKTGLRGWNEYEQPMVDRNNNPVDFDDGDDYFATRLLKSQMKPEDWVD